MARSGVKVIAIEPQPLFANFLRRFLPKKIAVLEVAVGGSNSEAALAVSSLHPTLASLRTDFVAQAPNAPGFEHVRWDSEQIVKMVTLDNLIQVHGNPRYLKIDVEGFELEVLSGLSAPIEIISVEYLPAFPDLTDKVLARLTELGDYRFNAIVGEKPEFLWTTWHDASEVASWLRALPRDARSGDLFARLETDKS
jgi:FkbM family methyltransferase